jgi:hypothetical protein
VRASTCPSASRSSEAPCSRAHASRDRVGCMNAIPLQIGQIRIRDRVFAPHGVTANGQAAGSVVAQEPNHHRDRYPALPPLSASTKPTTPLSAPRSARYTPPSSPPARGTGIRSELKALPQFGQCPLTSRSEPRSGSAARAGGELLPHPARPLPGSCARSAGCLPTKTAGARTCLTSLRSSRTTCPECAEREFGGP